MARKNLIGISGGLPSDAPVSQPASVARPLAGMTPAPRTGLPVGGISKTLGSITQKMERAQDLERQLSEGLSIVELDPSLIDASFVSDRLAIEGEALAQLVEQVREHGQQVPILVRPHPGNSGRYQVAYGHRRLAAVRSLGIKVKAVVRELTDDQLVVSQGQENNARTNLSHIERALFAARLEDRSFSRDTIMAALAVDKAALSKMISLVRSVPMELIEAIGPAPEIGRRRWMELAEKLHGRDLGAILKTLRERPHSSTSDQRFQIAFSMLSEKPEAKQESNVSALRSRELPVTYKKSGNRSTFVFDAKTAPGFDDFVNSRLAGLFHEFNQTKGE
ncbi:plasmid partitioning protein RepB [Neorhizobium alkalisoli]|uniref:ParB family chromosome partitioning protein n=1 Tax=Neorhizobium alkalisoli TaxID=528178 RepID=A0A561R8W8_9HYPH|nr:plasmid partitioning protein RepB [Neorhizobium alkalisoli]TWF59063.1 ParB family chromosome partitioning protein [Neorhizobium alkalisoli]